MENKKYIVIAVVLLIVAGAAGWLATQYYFSPGSAGPLSVLTQGEGLSRPHGSAAAGPEAGGEAGLHADTDAVPVKIFTPSAGSVAVEEVQVPNNPVPVKMAETVLAEYFKRLKNGPRDIKVLGVYRDRRNTLYVDLSDDFRRKFSGDAREEYTLLGSLFDTIVTNVIGVEDVRLLIEGKEVESAGGHFSILSPLKELVKEEHNEDTPQHPASS
ncbi:MAG: GerMN domain-containing protein [Nitrospirota bacterium]